jgi:hypothetical protein
MMKNAEKPDNTNEKSTANAVLSGDQPGELFRFVNQVIKLLGRTVVEIDHGL